MNPDRPLKGIEPAIAPIPSRSRRPPADWAEVEVDGDVLRVRLAGWRSVLALKRRVEIPVERVVSVAWEPLVYAAVPTTLVPRKKPRSHLYRLGVYRGRIGWSFWACGLGRNAIVIETEGYRFRFVVVERHDSADVAGNVNAALGKGARDGDA